MPLHKSLTQEKWSAFTLHEQMAHIGAEVGRSLNWKRKGDADHAQRAFERALELFDFTLAHPHSLPRLREIARAREVFCDYVAGDNEYDSDDVSFDRYFYPFNYAARKDR